MFSLFPHLKHAEWSNRQGQGIEAYESSRDMVTVLERRRDIPGMPFNIGTIGEGHPMAANNLVLRRINLRNPLENIGVPLSTTSIEISHWIRRSDVTAIKDVSLS
jgi:hypothetical protein